MSDEETPESQPEKGPTEAPPSQPPQGAPEKPANPTTALILSIAGLLCCAPVAIFGILMGNKVKKQISEGRNDPANASTATVAQIIGYVALGLWAIGIVLGLITGAFTSKEVSREISDSVGATPAASQKPNADATWQTVITLDGSDSKKSQSFELTGAPARLRYEVTDTSGLTGGAVIFNVHIIPEGRTIGDLAVSTLKQGSEETALTQSRGKYFLDVGIVGSNKYHIVVEEQR